MSNPNPIAFYYDFVSPYSYFAFSQRTEIEQRTGRSVELKPVSVGMVMDEVGNVPTSITCKTKQAYLGQDVARWVSKLGVPFASHPQFGLFSTAPLIKAALRAGSDVEAFSEAAFAAVWSERAPISDEAAMQRFFEDKDPRFGEYWAGRDTISEALVARVKEAVGVGVFGVPYFHTDRGDFFGNDRLEFLVEALAA
jgi:2-hydroxychromene-2-carboxylate isomerase